jgi:mannose-6-phosphate isomerase-like protein (cupin superfamily)
MGPRVYEDQGEPFVLCEGDCVLQPPRIRHRVLEASPGLEVIEIGSPAEHETFADHETILPTATVRRDRDFGGQRFVRHEAAHASWLRRESDGAQVRDLGIDAATGGFAKANVVCGGARTATAAATMGESHDVGLLLAFVLAGDATLACGDRLPEPISEGDAYVVPPKTPYALTSGSASLQRLEVVLAL